MLSMSLANKFRLDSCKDALRTILAVELPLLSSVCEIFGKQILCQPHVVVFFERVKYNKYFPSPFNAAVVANIGWLNLAPQLLLSLYPRSSLQVFELYY